MRLNRQIHPTGLEDRQNSDQPIQIALDHHSHHTLTAQPASQQRPSQPVSTAVQLPVSQLPSAIDGRDGFGMSLHLLLEQLVNPAIRQTTPRSSQPFELEVDFLGGQQALPTMLGIQIGGDQLQCCEVITGNPCCGIRIEYIGPVPQSQPELAVASLSVPTRSTVSSERSPSSWVGSSPVGWSPVG